jgi:2-C-methyl-D-erythritol 2,4-cyclodiphosphate synthase
MTAPLPLQTPRIGLGSDRHVLVAGRPCVLGGVLFEDSPIGPLGHSDADAILHALTDALLGAAGLDDLGTLFPDSDPKWSGADSTVLLRATLDCLKQAGLRCWSADIVAVCMEPKIGPRRGLIRERLAGLLGLPSDRVNLKGKTPEGGETGPAAIEVTAVVLLGPLENLAPSSVGS